MHESVDESLRKICKYRLNVLQRWHFFDKPVLAGLIINLLVGQNVTLIR